MLKGLFYETDILTTCVVVIIRVSTLLLLINIFYNSSIQWLFLRCTFTLTTTILIYYFTQFTIFSCIFVHLLISDEGGKLEDLEKNICGMSDTCNNIWHKLSSHITATDLGIEGCLQRSPMLFVSSRILII